MLLKLKYLTLVILAFAMFQCTSKKLSYNYETEPLEQGAQGTVLFKVYSYGEDVDEAIERAKMDAVHAVLFRGVPGSNLRDPLLNNPEEAHKEHNEFFEDFFGVELIDQRLREQGGLRYGPESAPYRLYVDRTTDSINPSDRVKVDGGYRVGVTVSVNHSSLRDRLEREGIIKGFGL